ncbi:MAG: hypothetical protein R2737_16260 [Candidatus Nanopelagicales bacterium]
MFEHTVAVNLVGSFNLLRLAAETMAAQEPDGDDRGVVVLTASICAAYDGQVGQVDVLLALAALRLWNLTRCERFSGDSPALARTV